MIQSILANSQTLIYRWFLPFIGHMGIAYSSGVIRDFAGPYFVSEDNMAFGWPTKYWMLDPYRAHGGPAAFDNSIQLASQEYQGRMVSNNWLFLPCSEIEFMLLLS